MRIVNGKIEFKVATIPKPFPGDTHAVCVWPFIWYEEPWWDDPCQQAHERYHWIDQMRWLVIPWFIVYLAFLPFTGGGPDHPLEREGYRRERACRAIGQ